MLLHAAIDEGLRFGGNGFGGELAEFTLENVYFVASMLDGGGAVGRKLDFLLQEMNREANTIGSKCTDVKLARVVVDIKAELEKIREQTQNIE